MLKSFQGNIAFISLVIISSIFIFSVAAFAETINYTYDDAGQVVKAVYADGETGTASCMRMINPRTGW
jgi:YD repeat-containing protein